MKRMGSKSNDLFQRVWPATPLIIAVLILIMVFSLGFKRNPSFTDYNSLVNGNLNDAQKHTISMVTELNKFMISITTLLFGVLGFFLINYRKKIHIWWTASAYFISLILLSFANFWAFLVYSQLAYEFAQNTLAMTPGKSKTLYYLEMSFWTSAGASLILLFLFVFVFIAGSDEEDI
ncbi:MAG: hypothetical protein ACHQ2F_02125 [Desulfobaccales bacterium]